MQHSSQLLVVHQTVPRHTLVLPSVIMSCACRTRHTSCASWTSCGRAAGRPLLDQLATSEERLVALFADPPPPPPGAP